jgi:hypothetical protein
MANFLKFYSVGGGSLESNDPGDFIISIDQISGQFSSPTQFQLLFSSPYQYTSETITSISFNVRGNPGIPPGTVVANAIMDAIISSPGGNIDLTMPKGYEIDSFEFIGFII